MISAEWAEKLAQLKAEWADKPWDPYNPRGQEGWLQLSQIENLPCVLCVGFRKAIKISEPEIQVACDYDSDGYPKTVTILPNPTLSSAGTISPNSEKSCPRKLFVKPE